MKPYTVTTLYTAGLTNLDIYDDGKYPNLSKRCEKYWATPWDQLTLNQKKYIVKCINSAKGDQQKKWKDKKQRQRNDMKSSNENDANEGGKSPSTAKKEFAPQESQTSLYESLNMLAQAQVKTQGQIADAHRKSADSQKMAANAQKIAAKGVEMGAVAQKELAEVKKEMVETRNIACIASEGVQDNRDVIKKLGSKCLKCKNLQRKQQRK